MSSNTQKELFEADRLIGSKIIEAHAFQLNESADAAEEALLTEASRHQTAKKAARILVGKDIGFVIPSARQKSKSWGQACDSSILSRVILPPKGFVARLEVFR